MPEWLIALLVQFLIEFLTQLFKKIFGAADPAIAKPQFLSQVKWRIWYGPKRMAIAGSMYDHVVNKYRSGQYAVPQAPWKEENAELLAKQLCSDLTKAINEGNLNF